MDRSYPPPAVRRTQAEAYLSLRTTRAAWRSLLSERAAEALRQEREDAAAERWWNEDADRDDDADCAATLRRDRAAGLI